ncbi:MAG: hypothetical protein AABZ60_08290 [Planctomycetota bacterium]
MISCVHSIHPIVEEEQGKIYLVQNLYEEEQLRHPYSFKQEDLIHYLDQVNYIYDHLFSWSSPKPVFSSEERTFLAKYLVTAFEEAKPHDEIRFQTEYDGFTNRGSCVIRNGSLEFILSTVASDSFYEDHSYLDSSRAKWRLSPGSAGEHLKRPQFLGSDVVLYNTLKTPLAKIASAQSTTTAKEPEKKPPAEERKTSGSGIELEQKWLNEEIERTKREEEKEIND